MILDTVNEDGTLTVNAASGVDSNQMILIPDGDDISVVEYLEDLLAQL